MNKEWINKLKKGFTVHSNCLTFIYNMDIKTEEKKKSTQNYNIKQW